MKQSILPPFEVPIFDDKRLDNRAYSLINRMVQSESSVINRIFGTFSEKVGAYRMLNNKKTKTEQIIRSMSSYCHSNITEGIHYLCLQDTTEINFEAHRERMSKKQCKLGLVSNNQIGCFLHPMLVINAQSGTPVGFASVKVWSRNPDKLSSKDKAYKNLPIEKKESYRWVEAGKKAHKLMGKEALVTVISDRESDIYNFISDVPNANTHILIRSNQDRCLETEEKLLKETMQQSMIRHTYQIELTNEGRKKRKCLMELHYEKVIIKRPIGNKSKKPSVTLYCILTRESAETVPAGENPIEWCLLTTHEVESEKQALKCVDWYKCRWYIEELFRVLKKDGFCVEDIQLESMPALHKLLLFALQAALQVITLKLAYDKPDEELPASNLFSKAQISLLQVFLRKVNGKTEKLKNPFKPESLPWASWILARIGGWTGYKSQSTPGYITFKIGLDKFYTVWEIYDDFEEKDVYKE